MARHLTYLRGIALSYLPAALATLCIGGTFAVLGWFRVSLGLTVTAFIGHAYMSNASRHEKLRHGGVKLDATTQPELFATVRE